MTRELKLALIVGFSVVLVVTVLIADHLSPGSQSRLAMDLPIEPPRVVENPDVAIVEAPKAERVMPLGNGSDRSEFGTFTAGDVERFDTPVFGPNGGQAPREPGTIITLGRNGGVDTIGNSEFTGGTPDGTRTVNGEDPIRAEIERRGGTLIDGVAQLPGAIRTVQQPTSTSGVPEAGLPGTEETAKPTTAVKPQPARSDDRAHTVVEGDSAYKIAQRYYGDAKLWPKLAAYNGNRIGENGRLRSGITLRIPAKEVLLGGASIDASTGRVTQVKDVVKPEVKPEAKSQPKTTASRGGKTAATVNYTVKKGDTLREVARRELGSTKRMNEIVELNRKVIRDVDNLPLGAVIKLPAKTV